MLTSKHRVVVVTGDKNRYEGVVRVETILDAMQAIQQGEVTASETTAEDIEEDAR